MSNEMTVIPAQLPAHLQSAPNMTEEFAGGTTTGMPLPSMSIRGKEFRLRKDGQEHNTRLRDMEIIFVAARPGQKLSKRYYARKYEGGEGDAPDCSSADGITPDVPEPVSPSCATCPMNAWGSKTTESGKEGKACQDYKRVVIWPIGISVESPVVLDLSATNVRFTKEQRKHTNALDYAGYVSMVNKHGLSLNKVVTRIEFTDAEYPQIAFKFSRLLDEKEMTQVLEMREMPEVNEVLKTDVHVTGEAAETEAAKLGIAMAQRANTKAEEAKAEPKVEQPAEPAPAPQEAKPEPKPFTPVQMVDPEDGTELIAKSEAQLKKLTKAGYEVVGDEGTVTETSVEVATEPAEEPKKEETKATATQTEDDGSSALLAQLQGFLSNQ